MAASSRRRSCLVALVVLVVVIVRLDRAAGTCATPHVDFRAEAEPALAELREVVRTPTSSSTASTPSCRGAERVSGRVDAASDLAYRTFTNPVVKALAVGTGTRRAVQRLKGEPPKRRRKRRRPDVQAGHLARRGLQPRRGYHRRRRPQGPPTTRPLQAPAPGRPRHRPPSPPRPPRSKTKSSWPSTKAAPAAKDRETELREERLTVVPTPCFSSSSS